MKRLTIILFTFLFITGLSTLAQNKATISFNALIYDYGKINEDDGIKSGKFEFRNTGNDTLRISIVNSSYVGITCNWTKSPVPPKGAGFIEARFDPKGRPGNLQQLITVYSNDLDQPKVNLTLKAEVAAHVKSIVEEYPYPIGNLRMNNSQLSFQNINNTEIKTDTLKIYNEWGQDMNLSFRTVPAHMKCTAVPENLKPQQKGYILVTYDAGKRNDWGYVNDRFSISTNDTAMSEKSISVSANIIEDFKSMTAKQLEDAAKIKFETLTYNFDTITEGKDIEYDFKFTNVGKDDLFIRKVKGSWGCTASNADKSELKKNEGSFIHVTVNTRGKSGNIAKTVTVTTNDPTQSTVILNLKGYVKKADTTQENDVPGSKPTPQPLSPQH